MSIFQNLDVDMLHFSKLQRDNVNKGNGMMMLHFSSPPIGPAIAKLKLNDLFSL